MKKKKNNAFTCIFCACFLLVCALINFDRSTPVFPILIFFVIIFALIGFIMLCSLAGEEERMKNEEEELKKKKQILAELKNSDSKIEEQYNKFSSKINVLLNYATMLKPSAPLYTEGVVAGSLADNVSYLANQKKKEEYKSKCDEYNKYLHKSRETYKEFLKIEKQLKELLTTYDNASMYIQYHDDVYNNAKKIIEKYVNQPDLYVY
ncbi:hypothetical protein [Ruminococcus sp.]|uniref:hypothetical protein n=1 Tax=Ruminococcus sp. TaxID=41978 RepID=UPI004026D11D